MLNTQNQTLSAVDELILISKLHISIDELKKLSDLDFKYDEKSETFKRVRDEFEFEILTISERFVLNYHCNFVDDNNILFIDEYTHYSSENQSLFDFLIEQYD